MIGDYHVSTRALVRAVRLHVCSEYFIAFIGQCLCLFTWSL